jgi:hypothetical protein
VEHLNHDILSGVRGDGGHGAVLRKNSRMPSPDGKPQPLSSGGLCVLGSNDYFQVCRRENSFEIVTVDNLAVHRRLSFH